MQNTLLPVRLLRRKYALRRFRGLTAITTELSACINIMYRYLFLGSHVEKFSLFTACTALYVWFSLVAERYSLNELDKNDNQKLPRSS